MDQCPPESMWVRCVAAELTPAEEAALREHARGCAACASRWGEMRAVWDVLREWTVHPPPADLASVVLEGAEHERRRARWVHGARVAAAIALAAGLGFLAGRLTPADRGEPAKVVVSEEEAIQRLGLDVLGPDSAVLANLLMADEGDELSGQETPL